MKARNRCAIGLIRLAGICWLRKAVRFRPLLSPDARCRQRPIRPRTTSAASGHVVVLDPGVRHDVEALEESAFLLSIAGAPAARH